MLAFIGWAFADTARISYTAPLQAVSNETDYGQLAHMALANTEVFPSDALLSQLQSYVIPNRNLRGNAWDQVTAINSSCPVQYKRPK